MISEKETKKKEGIIKGGFLTVVSISKFFVSQSDFENPRKMKKVKKDIFTSIKSALGRL